jgi:hypothetical protein
MGLVAAAGIVLALQGATQGTPSATVAGTVRDESTGRALANAVVLLADLNQSTTTDLAGRYILRNVPPGPQHINIRFIGYSPRTLDALVPRDGDLEINIGLRPHPVPLSPIEVRASSSSRSLHGDDTTPFPDREAYARDFRTNPILAEPDAFLVFSGGEVVVDPESPSGLHIRGGSADQIGYLLDGIPILSPYHVGGMFSAWNPDALSSLTLSSSSPSPALPGTISGAITGTTRTPGPRASMQGSISTSQARLTMDGPLGIAGAGYLVSLRNGYLPRFTVQPEASYLRSETSDWLAKLEVPVLSGRLRLLGYESNNEISADAAGEQLPAPPILRNDFYWHSLSLGGEWNRMVSSFAVRLIGWSAAGDAASRWNGLNGIVDLTARRRDEGILASVGRASAHGSSLLGIRLERSRTSYRIAADSSGISQVTGSMPVATLFGQYVRAFSPKWELAMGASMASANSHLYLGPRGQLRWKPVERLIISGSYSRLHQFGQSLRNAESVVGYVFPVDLYMVAGAGGVPVAQSDQGVLAADYEPIAGLRLSGEVYQRRFNGVLLVAQGEPEPFATGVLNTGSGRARGLALRASLNSARYAVSASYGLQQVRLNADSTYVPGHGATHLLQGGVILFPTATSSIRIGASSAFGRRVTTVSGSFEWETCNLLDQGCEFGGSPHYGQEPLGGTRVPAYLRVDLGARKHWHLRISGREATVALFGTVSNILGRRNYLTYSRDQSTGELAPIEMRPRAPLVVGLDWRF